MEIKLNDTEKKDIVTFLKGILDKKGLDKLYDWNWNLENEKKRISDGKYSILSEQDIEKLFRIPNELERTGYLLENFKILKENNECDSKTFNWIVTQWGKINSEVNDKEIEIIKTEASKLDFDRISSTSKIAFFWEPDNYIIYDSRVAYAVNWLLLKFRSNGKFFPKPEGRNSKMNAFNIDTIIRLSNRDVYDVSTELNNDTGKLPAKFISTKDKKLYIDEKSAYSQMNNLIKEIHDDLYEGRYKDKPYYTQFLLFAIADTYILEDILKSDIINIKKQ